jgi:large repetitive protein
MLMSRLPNSTPSIYAQNNSNRRQAKRRSALQLKQAAFRVEALEARWLLSAAPKFSTPTDFSTGVPTGPGAMVVSDINGDGIPDIVTLSDNGDVSVLLGNGDGTFQRAQAVPDLTVGGSYYQQNLAVAHVNGQSVILASSIFSDTITELGPQNGILKVIGEYSTGSHGNGIEAMTLATVGGSQELIAAHADGSLTISQFAQTGNPGFSGFSGTTTIPSLLPHIPGQIVPARSLAVGNFILGGDGADLVAVGDNGTADLLPGVPNGFGAPVPLTAFTNAERVYNAGPGNVLVLEQGGTVVPLFGGGGSSPLTAFTDPGGTIATGDTFYNFLNVGDFNGDGLADFAVPSGANSFKVFTGNDAGVYTAAGTFATSTHYMYSLASGDLTGDGKTDLVLAYSPVYTNPGVIGVRLNQVPSAPVFTSASSATALSGNAFSFTVSTFGFPAPTLYLEGGSLPQGLTFTNNGNGTATISGTPNPFGNTTYNLVFTAKNSVSQINQNFTLRVDQPPTFTTPNSLTGVVGTAITPFLVKTTGGFPVPTMADFGSVPPGILFTDNGNGTATISGTPTVSGVFTFDVAATSGPFVVGQAITMTVDEKPLFAIGNAAFEFTDGTFGTTGAAIDASNGGGTFPVPALTLTGGVLPAGMSLHDNGNGTATISGTPQFGDSGEYILKVTATSPVGSATLPVYLFIAEQPAITSANNASFTVGKSGQTFTVQTIGSTGFGPPSFNNALDAANGISGPLPLGLSFKDNANGTATISGTPAPGTGGVYILHLVTASDVNGNPFSAFGVFAAGQIFTLTVNQAPTFAASSTAVTVASGAPIVPDTIAISSGAGNITMQLTGGALPAGLIYTDNGNGTATISGIANIGTAGVYNLTITASNSAGSATEKVALTVIDPPIFTNGVSASFIEGTPGTFSVTTKPTTPSPTLSVLSVTVAGTFNVTSLGALGLKFKDNGNGTATLSGTPVAGSGGTYQIVFEAQGADSLVSVFGISLTIESRPLLFLPVNVLALTVGETLSMGITATNLGTSPPSIYLASGKLPPGFSFVDNGDGTATISGAASVGDAGPYSVQINAKNAVGTAVNGPQTLVFQIAAQPAITSAPNATFTVGKSFQNFTFTSTGNSGTGVPSFNSAVVAQNGLFGTLPAGVTFKDNGNGTATLTGTPLPGTGGVYHLQLETVSDTNGIIFGAVGLSPALQNFTLTVDEAPTFASGTAGSTVLPNVPITIPIQTLTGFGTPTLKVTSGNLPTGMTFTDNGNGSGYISGAVQPSAAGVYNFTIVASNSTGNATLNYRLQVDQIPGFAAGTSLNVQLTHGKSVGLVFNTTGFPGPIGILAGSLSGLPPGLTLAPNSTGTELILKGTPTVTGVFNVLFTLVNSDGFVSLPFDLLLTIT